MIESFEAVEASWNIHLQDFDQLRAIWEGIRASLTSICPYQHFYFPIDPKPGPPYNSQVIWNLPIMLGRFRKLMGSSSLLDPRTTYS
jgi:hypothetical protein